jgi:predicted enzyme related to lactoylglutathione lyase
MTMASARLNYVELPVGNITASRDFFASAFGWDLTAFGPDYAATIGAGCDLGLNGDSSDTTAAPLAVIETDDLEAALAAVEKAGGTVTRPIFAFPGGRRFHFREPSGNEMAVYINEPS